MPLVFAFVGSEVPLSPASDRLKRTLSGGVKLQADAVAWDELLPGKQEATTTSYPYHQAGSKTYLHPAYWHQLTRGATISRRNPEACRPGAKPRNPQSPREGGSGPSQWCEL
jgi:hypothetical protein